MELIALLLIGAALGAALGALGGGGGILAIPLLVHVAGQSVDQATTTSLIVVALGAAAGLIPHAMAGRVDWRSGLLFGALGLVGATLGARAALVADDRLQMVGIVALMFLAAAAMLRNAPEEETTRMRHRVPARPGMRVDTGLVIPAAPPADGPPGAALPTDDGVGTATATATTTATGTAPPREPYSWSRLLVAATGTGLVTGFFGVGGGFIAVPALVFGLRLPVKTATATGLLVIVINSMVALLARGPGMLDPQVTIAVGAATAVAAVVAAALSRHMSSRVTKKAFGGLLLVMAFAEIIALATTAA